MVFQGRAHRRIGGDVVVAEVSAGAWSVKEPTVMIFAAVAGAGDGEVAVQAVITGRGHDDVTRIPHLLHRKHQRIRGVTFFDALTQRQVDHPNVRAGAVDEDPVERGDHVGHLPWTVPSSTWKEWIGSLSITPRYAPK